LTPGPSLRSYLLGGKFHDAQPGQGRIKRGDGADPIHVIRDDPIPEDAVDGDGAGRPMRRDLITQRWGGLILQDDAVNAREAQGGDRAVPGVDGVAHPVRRISARAAEHAVIGGGVDFYQVSHSGRRSGIGGGIALRDHRPVVDPEAVAAALCLKRHLSPPSGRVSWQRGPCRGPGAAALPAAGPASRLRRAVYSPAWAGTSRRIALVPPCPTPSRFLGSPPPGF